MKAQTYGMTGIGGRTENEDSYACSQNQEGKVYAIVADGLGGHGGGKKAASIAVECLSEFGKSKEMTTYEKLTNQLAEANRKICRQQKNAYEMKTTAVYLEIFRNQAIWAHIGDSRLYHYYQGELADATLDHSICQIAVMMGEITRNQIPGHPDRSRILRVLGEETAEPEVKKPVTLQPGNHAFLLCSDGFWEYLREEEIMLDLHKSVTPEQWIRYLLYRGNKRRKKNADNYTAVAVFAEI